jgi:hypothetical protein
VGQQGHITDGLHHAWPEALQAQRSGLALEEFCHSSSAHSSFTKAVETSFGLARHGPLAGKDNLS